MRLQQRQARETGICPVRRELYSQCFGELSDCWSVMNLTEHTCMCTAAIELIVYTVM